MYIGNEIKVTIQLNNRLFYIHLCCNVIMLNSNTTIKRLIKYFIIRIVRSSTWKYPTMNLTEEDIFFYFFSFS